MTGSAADQDLLELMARLKAEQRPFALATVVRTVSLTAAKAGAKAVVLPGGEVHGWVGGGCAQGAVRRTALAALADGEARLISVKPNEVLEAEGLTPGESVDGVAVHRSVCPSGGTIDVFIEPMLPAPILVVCGRSPVARALAGLAPGIGFTLEQPSPETDLQGGRGERYIVIATQGQGDFQALAAALATEVAYIAFVGSRRKMTSLRARLIESGVAPSRAEAVRAPAGLDIGSITPEEIALSILAEVVKERRSGIRDDRS